MLYVHCYYDWVCAVPLLYVFIMCCGDSASCLLGGLLHCAIFIEPTHCLRRLNLYIIVNMQQDAKYANEVNYDTSNAERVH
jgi:hypothetical protein